MWDSTGKNEKGSSSIHGPEWIIDINNHLKQPPFNNSSKLCIRSRVPQPMRLVDEDNYIPNVVSIGPFHRNNPSLKAIEAHILRFLYGLLDPMSHRTHTVDNSVKNWREQNVTLQGLEKEMKELEKKTRDCYSDKFDDLSSDEFVRMMLLDGCFIIELVRWHGMTSQESKEDPILSSRFMLPEILRDLVMLENQLPLFLLQRLYTLTGPADQDTASFNNLAIRFLNDLIPERQSNEINVSSQEHAHILALFHSSFITNTATSPERLSGSRVGVPKARFSSAPERLLGSRVGVPKAWFSPKAWLSSAPEWLLGSRVEVPKAWFSSATALWCAGIKFKKKRGYLLEIRFANRVLEIPPLTLGKTTIQLLRNAVAYEQCNRSAKPYFTTLVYFFNTLVGSPKEVELLRKNDIIRTLDSNEQAANVIRNLTRGIVYDMNECCIPEVINRIKIFTSNVWTVWKATLNLYYFVNQEPINLVLFYFTIIQTFSSLYQIFTS